MAYAIISYVIRSPFCGTFVFWRDSVAVTHNFSVAIRTRDPFFLHVRTVFKRTPGLNLQTRGPSEDLTFSARARKSPPNALPFQLVAVNSTIFGTSKSLLLKYSAHEAFPSTKQQLFFSRLKSGTSKYRFPPSSLRRLLPFVFDHLPLFYSRHCCLRYLP